MIRWLLRGIDSQERLVNEHPAAAVVQVDWSGVRVKLMFEAVVGTAARRIV